MALVEPASDVPQRVPVVQQVRQELPDVLGVRDCPLGGRKGTFKLCRLHPVLFVDQCVHVNFLVELGWLRSEC